MIFPQLKRGEPLYSIAGSEVYIGNIIIGTLISVILFFINRRGVSASAKLQRILCFILVLSGVVAMVAALFNYNYENYQPIYENINNASHNTFIGGALSILASVPFFIAGFETIPQGIECAGGDYSKIGKTVVFTVVLSCLFYALLLLTIGGAVPWREFVEYDSPAAALLFKNIYRGAVGQCLYLFILIGAVCGLITTWNGFMMASSQILMSMARVSIVPNRLSEIDNKYGTPHKALIVCLIVSLMGPFMGSGLIESLTTFSAAGYVMSWAITAFSLVKLRKSEPELPRPYTIPGGIKTACFAGIAMACLLTLMLIPGQPVYMGDFATTMFIVWMFFGLVLFVADYRQRKRFSRIKRASILFASMEANGFILPEYEKYFEHDYRILSFRVPEDADYVGDPLVDVGWGKNNSIYVIKIEHINEIVLFPNKNCCMHSEDRVFCLGSDRSINKFINCINIGQKYSVFELTEFMGLKEHEKLAPITCIEKIVGEKDFYCGKTIAESGFQDATGCVIVGIKKNNDVDVMTSPKTVVYKGDVLWIVGIDSDIEKLKNDNSETNGSS